MVTDVFDAVVGQPGVVAQLRASTSAPVHAYLLVGDPGAGAAAAAQAFAAALLCPDRGCGACRDCRLALAGEHPDAVTFAPQGASLSVKDDVPEIIRLAMRSPVEGPRKVLILTDLHRIQQAGPALLKTIEEPPASTVFVLLADHVPAELVTVASRSVRIDVPPLPADRVESALLAEGVLPEVAAVAAAAARGSLARARLLASDPGLARRREQWASVPQRLDGTGAAVMVVVDELLGGIEEAMEPLAARQSEELAALEERVAVLGERGSGRRGLAEGHKREQRRHRTEELRFGLATLADRYRTDVDAVGAIDAAGLALSRNPNEKLLLQHLLLRLS